MFFYGASGTQLPQPPVSLYSFDFTLLCYTKAHALMEHLKETDNEKANQLMEIMYHEYFENAANINSTDVLISLAKQVGMDEGDARQAMENKELLEGVRAKDVLAKTKMRVTGVPFFIIEPNGGGRPVAFSGAQPADVIAEVLEDAA
jgi:predicted DsbA family dithiol-disulfide isomerase